MMNSIVRSSIFAAVMVVGLNAFSQSATPDYQNNPLTTNDPLKTGFAEVPAVAGTSQGEPGVIGVQTPSTPQLQELNIDKKQAALLNQEKTKAQSTWQKYYDQAVHTIENSDIGFSIPAKFTILDAFNFAIKDHVEIAPSYIGGHFTRYDSYNLTEDFRPLLWWLPSSNPLLLSLAPQQELGVWRVYDSYKKATRRSATIPFIDYVGSYLPLNADVILKRFEPGTMVRFHLPLNILAGLGYGPFIGNVAQLFGETGRLYSGDYEIYVFRGDKDKIRLRLVAKASKEWITDNHGGIVQPYLTSILPSAFLARLLFHIFKLDDLGGFKFEEKLHQDIFLADYTLDLSHQEVKDAYNRLFDKALVFTDKGINWSLWAITNPLKDRAAVANMLVSDLTELERIYNEDLKSQPDATQRRVERNFIGDNEGINAQDHQHHYGVSALYKIQQEWSYRENHLTDDSDSGNPKYYIFPQWLDDRKRTKFIVDRHDLLRSANIVYEADKDFNPTAFSVMGFYYDLTESRYKDKIHQGVIEHFHNLLPPNVFSELETFLKQNDIVSIKDVARGVRVSGRYFVNDAGLDTVQKKYAQLNPREKMMHILNDLIVPLREARGLHASASGQNAAETEVCKQAFSTDGVAVAKNDIGLKYCSDLVFIAKSLAVVLDPSIGAKLRKDTMNGLVRSDLFTELGPAFVFGLIPNEFETAALRFELRFFLPGQIKPLSFRWPIDKETGKPYPLSQRKLLEQILDNEKMLNNEIPDLRLECREESLTCRDTRRAEGSY